MEYNIFITDTRTNEQRIKPFTSADCWKGKEDSVTHYYFTEGNMSCDCNLYNYFYDTEEDDPSLQCSEGVMRIDKIVNLSTGKDILNDCTPDGA